MESIPTQLDRQQNNLTRDQRLAELRRLQRRLFVITGLTAAVALAYAVLPTENLFPVVLWLVRHVHLTVSEASILVLSVYGVKLVVLLLVLIVVFKTGKAIFRLGCVECGTVQKLFSLNFRRKCGHCGTHYSATRP